MRPKVATFDCYGTLVDWEGGIGAFLYALMLREGVEDPPPGRELRERWEAIQFDARSRARTSPTRRSSPRRSVAWCREMGVPDREVYGDALVGSMRAWQPFPDTAPGAHPSARGRRAARDPVEHRPRHHRATRVKQIGVPFDDVVTAEDVGAYKPALTDFERLLDRARRGPGATCCTSRSASSTTSGPRSSSGMRTAWVNRHQEPLPDPDTVPDHEWRDLWGLAELAGG